MQRQSTWVAGAVLVSLAAAVAPCRDARAQTAQQDAMKKLDFLLGEWKGESWTEAVSGQRHESRGVETVQSKLGGLVVTLEGAHRRKEAQKEGELVHNAFAVMSYDEKAKRYRFQAFTARGDYTDAQAKVDNRRLEWGMIIPQFGEVHYTIILNDKGQWFEIGEVTQDGKVWRRFFEMTLERTQPRGRS
jgi:hypothetical protein